MGRSRCAARSLALALALALVPVLALVLVSVNVAAQAHPERDSAIDRDTAIYRDPAIERDSAVYVARRGWHIDVGFDTRDLVPPLSGLSAAFPGARFLFFGFGDRRYLESRHRRLPAMLAALWPGNGLILATGLTAAPGEAFGATNVIRLSASPGQSRAAQSFIWSSLRPTAAAPDRAQPLHVGPYDGSLYFAARPTYSAVHTCNTWAAEVLNAAGMPVRGAGIVFAWQLWNRLRPAADSRSERAFGTSSRDDGS